MTEQNRTDTNRDAIVEAVARSAVEIVQECRAALNVPKGELLTDAVRRLARNAARYEYIRDKFEATEDLSLGVIRERDKYSVFVDVGNKGSKYHTTLNYIHAGTERPGVAALLDEVIDAALPATTGDGHR